MILNKGDLVCYTGPPLIRAENGFGLSKSALGVVLDPYFGKDGKFAEVLWSHMENPWVGPQYWLKKEK
tara:strand:+ start:882 stop:1085 length:204 start_codon:yes stop_codon:yes gene_type:complete